MFSPTIITGLLLGISQIPSGIAQPVDNSSVIVSLTALDYFPHAKGDLSQFDVSVRYVGYDATTQSWLTGLNPASGTSDEEKAVLMTEAAYAKPFNESDPDMTEDVKYLLAAVAGNLTALEKRQQTTFRTAAAHAVNWATCASVLSCLSGATCGFSLETNKAPRSHCQVQGGSSCCISWSTYNVRAAFFSTTWTTCNNEVDAQGLKSASCEGYGSTSQGGDVCLSNRASGCT